jgi:hypothetical protein
MKKVFQLSLFACALGSLTACMSVSQSSDDSVYVMKGASIPVGESLSDETAYSTFKYKKDRNQPRSRYYLGNNMSSMQNYSSFSNRNYYYGNPYSSWSSPYYNYNYGNYGYNTYGSISMTPVWVYTPGWGWGTQMVMTNGYNPMMRGGTITILTDMVTAIIMATTTTAMVITTMAIITTGTTTAPTITETIITTAEA